MGRIRTFCIIDIWIRSVRNLNKKTFFQGGLKSASLTLAVDWFQYYNYYSVEIYYTEFAVNFQSFGTPVIAEYSFWKIYIRYITGIYLCNFAYCELSHVYKLVFALFLACNC